MAARKTQQKTVIHDILMSSGRPLSPQEILEEAQKTLPDLGIATVYRAVKALTESGDLATVEIPGESTRYERADHEHHHHFQCNDCQRVFDVPGCAGHLTKNVPAGFVVETHEVLLKGRCDACAA